MSQSRKRKSSKDQKQDKADKAAPAAPSAPASASPSEVPAPAAHGASRPPKGNKIFGVMTKRRWFGVCVFLLGIMWSYTAGPALENSHIAARYFMDFVPYNYSTVVKEPLDNPDLVDSIFRPLLFPDQFTWQVGSLFNWTEGPVFQGNKLLFTDTIANNIFSWQKHTGVQVEYEKFVEAPASVLSQLAEPGPNGLAVDPTKENTLYVCEHATRRVVKFDTRTKKKTVIAEKHNGKRLNSPNDILVSADGQYVYFTDPPFGLFEKSRYTPDKYDSTKYLDSKSELGFSGVFRARTDGSDAQNVPLLTSEIHRANGIALNPLKNWLYVTGCVNGKIDITRFQLLDGGQKVKKLHQFNAQNLQWRGNPIEGGVGCTDGLTVDLTRGYIFATCPGGKICVINEETKKLDVVVKMSDNVKLSNLVIGPDNVLYLTGNHSVWSIQLTPLPASS